MVTMYDVTCSRCSKAGEVPFKPRPDKPVLCKACYRATAGGRTVPDPKPAGEVLIDVSGLTVAQRVFVAAAVDMFKSQAS